MLFKYAGIIQEHKDDVKSLDFKNDILVSGSRDGSVKVYKNDVLIGEHSEHAPSYVNSVVIMKNGLVASAGTDHVINIWDSNDKTCVGALIGHTDNICSLYYGVNNDSSDYLVSGSWDKTARIWQEKECKYILSGHEGAVWRAIGFNHDTFITCSADKSIKIWLGSKCMHTIMGRGHTDVIRDIIKVSSEKFATVSNDGCICIWKLNGKLEMKWQAHDSFIYTISKCGDLLLTAGEDRCVKIWNNQECLQVIPIPAISIWKVVCANNSLIYIGCNDGCIYKFSDDPNNTCDDSLYKSKLESNKISSLEYKIESSDSLSNPGTKIGQTKVIMEKDQEGNKRKVYTWDGHQWQYVGEVVGDENEVMEGMQQSNSSIMKKRKKVEFENKEYDFVFDVSVEDDMSLKLPFNIGDNPYRVADQFIAKHELPANYVSQVAEFIMKNTPFHHGHNHSSSPFPSSQAIENHQSDDAIEKNKGEKEKNDNSPFPSLSQPFLQVMDCFSDAKLSGIQKKIREYNDSFNLNLTESDLNDLFSYKSSKLLNKLLEESFKFIPMEDFFPILDLTRIYPLKNKERDFIYLKFLENDLIDKLLQSSRNIGPNLLMLLRLYCNLIYVGQAPNNKMIIPELLRLAADIPKYHLPASSLLLNICKSSNDNNKLLPLDPHITRQLIAIFLQYLRQVDLNNEQIMDRITSSIYWLHMANPQSSIIKHVKVELELSKNQIKNTRTIAQIDKILVEHFNSVR